MGESTSVVHSLEQILKQPTTRAYVECFNNIGAHQCHEVYVDFFWLKMGVECKQKGVPAQAVQLHHNFVWDEQVHVVVFFGKVNVVAERDVNQVHNLLDNSCHL